MVKSLELVEIDREIFIQIYANETSDKLNLALIMSGKRIYGFDRESGFYHLHPFLNTLQHIPAGSPKSITDFVNESLELLIASGLL